MMGSMKSRFQLQCAAGGLATLLIVVLIAADFIGPAVAEIDEFDGSSYARNVSLDNVNIFWTIDLEVDTIRLALHAKVDSAAAALGWAGVGISEMGGMEGADIVVFEAAVRCVFFFAKPAVVAGVGSEKPLGRALWRENSSDYIYICVLLLLCCGPTIQTPIIYLAFFHI